MDATTSNRIARGLFAASQGVNQMIQIRMQMADKLFKEKLENMQIQLHEQDRQDTQAYRQANLARQDKAENAREAEAAAKQKTADANSASLIQNRAADLKLNQARLGIAMQDLEVSREKLARSISDHADKMSSDKLKEATAALTALNARIKNLQTQAATAQRATQQNGGNQEGDIAKAKTLYDSTMASIQQLNTQADAYTDHINQLTGVQAPTATKPLPKIGGKYIKLSNGSYVPYDPNNVPEGLNPRMAPIGTPRNQLQTGDVYTFEKPGMQMPNGAVTPMGSQTPDMSQPDD